MTTSLTGCHTFSQARIMYPEQQKNTTENQHHHCHHHHLHHSCLFQTKVTVSDIKNKDKNFFFKLDRQVVRFSNNNLGKIILNNKVHFQEKINDNTVPNKNTAKDVQNEGFGDRKSEKPNARVGFCCIRVKAVGEHIVMNHELSHSRHCQILQTQI